MKILILGGYGNVAKFLCNMILNYTNEEIVIAGRNLKKAEAFKRELSGKFDEKRIFSKEVDASNISSLKTAFANCELVINAASTILYSGLITEALLQTKTDYIDLLMSSPRKLDPLKKAEEKFILNNQCIITDGGFHPGIPAVMVRYISNEFDELTKANIGSLLNIDWKMEFSSSDTVAEFLYELKEYDSSVYIDGTWKRLSYKDYKKFNFGKPFGEKACIAMGMEEMKALPELLPSLKETGFYMAGFNPVTDYFVIPLLIISMKFFHPAKLKILNNLFIRSLKKFTKPPFKIILQLEAEGTKDKKTVKKKLTISHEDGYFLTAASVSACLLQYLSGEIKKPGLHFQSLIVNPGKFINDLKRFGCEIVNE